MSRPLLPLLAVVSLGCLAATPVAAQDFDPTQPLGYTAPTASAFELARPLPALARDLFFAGEADSRGWTLDLDSSEISRIRAFRLALLDRSVSSLPESATIAVLINGERVGSSSIALSPGGAVDLPVTPGLLVPGLNHVQILVGAGHRVDCSVAATYELWSQFDPGRTGFVGMGAVTPTGSFADLRRVLQTGPAYGHVNLVLPRAVSEDYVSAAALLGQELALAGRLSDPVVEVSTRPSGTSINVFMGTAAEDAPQGAPVSLSAEGVDLVRRAEGSGYDVVVRAGNAEQLREIVATLESARGADPAAGSPAALAALRSSSGLAFAGGEARPLSDFGFATQNIGGRRFAEDFTVVLPSDFYPADYGEARILLNGRYREGLQTDSRLLVHVNGVQVAILDIAGREGGGFQDHEIKLPLSIFHPNANQIRLEVTTITEGDLACDTARQVTETRFVLSESTEIEFPPFAHAHSLPELSTIIGDPGEMRIFLPGFDLASASVAATLAAESAVTRGELRPVDIDFSAPSDRAGTGIVVGALATLPDWAAELVEEDPIFAARAQEVEPEPVTYVASSEPLAWFAAKAEDAGEQFTALLLDTPEHDMLDPMGPGDLLVVQQAGLPDGVTGYAAAFDPRISPAVWTVITAASEGELASAVEGGALSRTLDGLAGRLTVTRGDSEPLTVAADHSIVVASEEPKPRNLRLVLAGWLSENIDIYVQLALAASALFGLGLFAFAHICGVRSRR